MMTTWIPTEADRNAQGFIRLPHERSLAELLPAASTTAEEEAAPAQRPTSRPWRAWAKDGAVLGGVLGVVLAAAAILFLARPAGAPAAWPTSTAAPTAAPKPTVVPTTAPPIAAYWAPGGERAPDLAAGTVFTPTARYGDTWVAVALPGGGNVWIGRAEAGALPKALPDLAPPTPAPPPSVAPAAPVAAPPALAPTRCASAGVPGKTVEVCGDPSSDLAGQAQRKWIETYGAAPPTELGQ